MNVRRGFFGLWLVLSVLFALSTAALFVNPVRKEFERSEIQDWPGLMVPMFCEEARGQDSVDYDSTLKLEDDPTALCWYELPKFRKVFPEYNNLSDKELADAMYSRAGFPHVDPPAPWKLVGFAVSLAFGVPLAVLTLGSPIAWAFAGFKK